MSLDKFAPVKLPLSRVGIWGNPWHGLVTQNPIGAATLTLPNGATRSYPRLTSDYPDAYGNTHRLKVPGTPPVTRSPEELAADTAAGLEWRNEAMLSGAHFDLYTKPLDGWIYVDPDGVRWRVSCPGLHDHLRDMSAPYAGTLFLARFGQFGADEEVHQYPFTISEWGQGGSVPFGLTSMDPEAPANHLRATVAAIKADGSAALVMLHVLNLSTTSVGTVYTDHLVRWPLGWLEITISGPGAAATVAINVARSRAQTATMDASGLEWQQDQVVGMWDDDGDLSADLWQGTVSTLPPGFHEYEGGACNHGQHLVRVVVGSGSMSLTQEHILACWYSPDGAIENLVVRYQWDGSMSFPFPAGSGGANSVTWTRSVACSSAWTISLRKGGLVVDSVTGDYAYTSTETVHFTAQVGSNNGQGYLTYFAEVLSPDIVTASVSMEGTPAFLTHDFAVPNPGRVLGTAFSTFAPMGLANMAATLAEIPAIAGARFPAPEPVLAGHNGNPALTEAEKLSLVMGMHLWRMPSDHWDMVGGVARQSGQVVGLLVRYKIAGGADTLTYRSAATPGGTYGSATTVPYENAFRHASWNPYTGQTSWLNATPVCWV